MKDDARRLGRALPSALAIIALVVYGSPRTVALAAGNSILIARPSGGHSGDLFYLSGSLPVPNHAYTIMMACPDWAHAALIDPRNVVIEEGPTTDSQGHFAAFPMHALMLQRVAESGCHLYSSPGSSPGQTVEFGPDIPGDYYIHPAHKRLSGCAVTMCSTRATTSARQVRAGGYETISLSAWPGAVAHITVLYRGQRLATRAMRLDYQGVAHLRTQAPMNAEATSQVQVNVRFTLGRYTASGKTSFVVVH